MKLINRIKLGAKEYSPEISLAFGIGLGVAAVIFAIKDGPKVHSASKKMADNLNEIKKVKDEGKIVNEDGTTEVYTNTDYTKDVAIETLKGSGRVLKAAAPEVILEIFSIIFTMLAFNLMKKKYLAAAAAALSYAMALNEYRKRVIEDAGAEADRKYFYGETKEKVEIEKEVVKNGKTKKVTDVIEYSVIDDSINSPLLGPYSIRLDENNPLWKANNGDPFYLSNQLSIIQEQMTRDLKKDEFLYLNTVLDVLQVKKITYPNLNTDIVQEVGWLAEDGDGFVDFGCFRYREDGTKNLELVTDKNGYVYLSFNCMPIIGRTARLGRDKDKRMNVIFSDPSYEK